MAPSVRFRPVAGVSISNSEPIFAKWGEGGVYENIQETPRKVTKRTERARRKPQKGKNPEERPPEVRGAFGDLFRPRQRAQESPRDQKSGGSRSGSAAARAHGRGDQAAGSSGKGCSWRQDQPESRGGFGDLSGQRQRPGSVQKIIDNITPQKAAP